MTVYDPPIPLLGLQPKELKSESERNICTPMSTVASLFTTPKTWRHPKCLLTDEQIFFKMWYYTQLNIIRLFKKGNSDICDNMDEPSRYYAKRNKLAVEG